MGSLFPMPRTLGAVGPGRHQVSSGVVARIVEGKFRVEAFFNTCMCGYTEPNPIKVKIACKLFLFLCLWKKICLKHPNIWNVMTSLSQL